MLSAIPAALALSGTFGISLLRMGPVQFAMGPGFFGSFRFSWLAPGPPIRSVSGFCLGIGTLRFPPLIEPRLKFLGNPLVRFRFGLEALDFFKPPIRPGGRDEPVLSVPVAYLKHRHFRVHGGSLLLLH